MGDPRAVYALGKALQANVIPDSHCRSCTAEIAVNILTLRGSTFAYPACQEFQQCPFDFIYSSS